jgi:hypothetical protein
MLNTRLANLSLQRPVLRNRRRRQRTQRDGGQIRHVDPHPPTFISFPWYNLTLRIVNPVTGNFSSANLQTNFVSQTGIIPDAGFILAVRFQSVRVWGALTAQNAATALQPMSMVVFDPIGATVASASGGTGASRVLEQITDFPNQVSRSVVGYVYPKAQREFVFLCPATLPVNVLALNGAGANSVMYINIQWRLSAGSPPTNLAVGDKTSTSGWFSS